MSTIFRSTLFNELDADGNGVVSIAELKGVIEEKYGDELDMEQVNASWKALMQMDGTLDITEIHRSMEDYETMEELVEEKVFPSPWQKRMMSKSWNDTFGPSSTLVLASSLHLHCKRSVRIVDGSGGNIAYEPNDSGLIPSGNIAEGDIYPCDEKFQKDGCRNSLTPLAVKTDLVDANQVLLGWHPLHLLVSDWNGVDTLPSPGESTRMAGSGEGHARV